MLTEPVQLLDHVPEVLTEVAAVCRVVLITKGDLVHQTRKITTSGIEHHFAELEIVLEKDAEVYTKLLQRFGVAARTVLHGRQLGAQRHPPGAGDRRATRCTSRITSPGSSNGSTTTTRTSSNSTSIADLPAWLGLR